MRRIVLIALAAVSACRGSAPPPAGNDAQRQTDLIERQARALQNEAESNVTAAEQAAENEGAALFENRARLLNETAGNDSANNSNAADAR